MKKKNLKDLNLSLEKMTISKLQKHSLRGGVAVNDIGVYKVNTEYKPPPFSFMTQCN